ncbi:AI-2E family transporter [Clostridium sp. SHJSY1]|uniref:AI-2E family transporter n=1 Tax=Clostridium sp. SHJSY1 TaxID=2942483 RepID=UPI00287524B9|nr:AI-2E family transporter [Clostridium sp. SHJSY1]MDS0524988.1 AI-2E family transporter [Clostridium sp. SHJSY1]
MNILKKHRRFFGNLIFLFIGVLFIVLYLFINEFKETVNIILISYLIAYILVPIRNRIRDRLKIKNRIVSLILILFLMILFIVSLVLLIPAVFKEIDNLEPVIKKITIFLEENIENSKHLNLGFAKFLYDEIKQGMVEFGDVLSTKLVDNIISISEHMLSMAVIPVVTYYFLADNKEINGKFLNLVPLEKRKITKVITSDINKLLSRYIGSQLILSVIVTGITFIMLLILKVKFSIALSILNGILNIIPYFGPIFGAIPIIFIALLDSPTKGLWTGIGIFLLQQIEGNILSPKITGDSINIHPLMIIILLIIGENFGGFVGMLIIVPIGVIIKVIWEDINYYIF